MNKRLIAFFPAVIGAVFLAACAGGGSTVVTVNGQTITKDQLDSQLENSPVAPQVVERLVQFALIDQYAKDHHISIPQSQIDATINRYKARLDGQWDQLLRAQGMTESQFADLLRRQMIINQAVSPNIRVSDKQIADYFNKNHAQFDQPPSAKARHILVSNLATASKVEADLKAGKDFAAEAKQYSQDPGSKNAGGELGWFNKGRMTPPFDQYVFSGPVGAISQPIKSFFGYHIIQIEARKPAQKATLASSRTQIIAALRQQQETPLVQPFLQQLQAGAKINVSDQRFADLFAAPAPVAAPPAPAPAPVPTKKK